MLRLLKKLWNWLQSLFNQTPTPSTPILSKPEITELDYENILIGLLDEVMQEKTWGQLQGWLMSRGVNSGKLAQWLQNKGDAWLSQGELEPELGRRLQKLADIAGGELGEVARRLTDARQPESKSNYQQPLNADAQFWFNQGCQQGEQGNFLEALASFDRAIQIQPDDYMAWSYRGLALGNLGRYEEALASFDQTIRIQPDYYQAWSNQGVTLDKLGRYEEALASFEQAIQTQPDLYQAWFGQGAALDKLGRYEEALASCDRAIQIQPDYYKAWSNRGLALNELGRYEEALASYNRVIQIQPDDYNAWSYRGLALNKLGRYEEAPASCDRAIQIQPDNYNAWYGRGFMLRNLGRYEEALASFDRAIQIQPDNYNAWYGRGTALGNLVRHEEALASYDQAIQIQPDDHLAWFNRGIAASQSTHYNPRYQQQFVELFEMELINTSQILLKSLENIDTEKFINQFLTSLASSDQLLTQTFPNLDLSTNTEPLIEFLRQNRLETLKNFIRQPLSPGVRQKLQQDTLLHSYHSNPALNLRGYEGELASYHAGLEFVRRDNNPEGWGRLHYALGIAHYFKGQRENNPRSYYIQAESCYETALEILTPEQFPEVNLEVLQDLIKVKLALGKLEEAENQQLEGLETLKQLLNQKTSTREKRQVEAKFNSFRLLRVNILVEKGKLIDALTSAELEKNRRLSHILEQWGETTVSPSYEEIQKLLNPNRAIIYWHLSPYGLTTFIVKHNQTPWDEIDVNLSELETWIETWDREYQDYRGKGKNKTQKMRQSHSWRKEMSDRLQQLKQILGIASLQSYLSDITELILVPHRDLHRFPLDYFFEDLAQNWTICYSPSLQIALNLQQKQSINPTIPSKDSSLLSVENPAVKNSANDLLFAEIESTVINQLFSSVTSLDRTVTQATLTQSLQQSHQIFHFTGHGYYNFSHPENSALILSNDEQLTVYEISHLNLSSYQLVCLAACETALTGNQTLEAEYVGLVSAFLKAGSTTVISTLWTVEEVSSAWLMISFYQLYLEGINPALALNKAKQWLQNVTDTDLILWLKNLTVQMAKVNPFVYDRIQDEITSLERNSANIDNNTPYAHPYYWAGFTLNGMLEL